MYLQEKKDYKWEGKDYVLSVLQFVIHSIVILGLFALTTLLYKGPEGFAEYITSKEILHNGIFIIITVFVLSAITYLYFLRELKNYLVGVKNITVLFLVIEVSYLVCLLIGHFNSSIFSRPVALCALLILLLINNRTAVYTNIIFNLLFLISDMFAGGSVETYIVIGQFITGIATSQLAVYLVDNVGSRIKVFGMGFIVSLPIAILGFAFTYTKGMDIMKVLKIIFDGFTSGILSVVIMMAFLPIFEYCFNILTNYRLAEITDHKSKLINKLREEAGGTFQHSLVVANLAETCATAIGENPLLARAAAYYHDMGKIKQPAYFTENQHGYNPHDDLSPELSTQIIRSHAIDGFNLIKRYHLPNILADVALEHHGTLPIQYFYNKARQFTDGDVEKEKFQYNGPKPSTKIAAIIMLADGCEAAVRAQNDRSAGRVHTVVSAIVQDRLKLEQFSNCDITMNEIYMIQNALEEGLSGVYHGRINYTKMKDKKTNMFASTKEKSSKEKKNGKA